MSSPVRVLHVVGGLSVGGILTWLMDVLRHADPDAVTMDFLGRSGHPSEFDDEIRARGGVIHPMPPTSNRRRHIWDAAFDRVLSEHGPYDAVHIHRRTFAPALEIAQRRGVPVRIVNSHVTAIPGLAPRNLLRGLRVAIKRRRELRHATLGIAFSKDSAAHRFGPRWRRDPRWQILPYAMDLKPFRLPTDPAAVRDELGLPRDALVVGNVGRLQEDKNQAFLIDVAAELARRDPRAWLMVVGEGPLRTTLEARAAHAGLEKRAIFTGERRDVRRLLAAMDVFVLPSIHEGLGIAGIEAQAAGRRVVRSDALPQEVEVIEALVTRQSLASGARAWADTIADLCARPVPLTASEALDSVTRGPTNIENSVRWLEAAYRGELGGRRE